MTRDEAKRTVLRTLAHGPCYIGFLQIVTGLTSTDLARAVADLHSDGRVSVNGDRTVKLA